MINASMRTCHAPSTRRILCKIRTLPRDYIMSISKLPADRTSFPATVESLTADLSALGIRAGTALMVHSSLSSLGWVNGGAVAVILALEQVLGSDGTLIMPTHTSDYSDPAYWQAPPVPQAWWQTIRDTMPAFDPSLTPTWSMGVIPETFRKQRGTQRSAHPQESFAAKGNRDFRTQGLQRDKALVLDVARQIDQRHPPAAQLLIDDVAIGERRV